MSAQARILFVDDEQRVLTAMRAMFRRDYEVHVANSGAEALEILREHAIDVVVSDQRMPEMTGVEVLKEARQIAPSAMRILLTGYADLAAIEDAINDSEVFRYLMKPCPREQLRETLSLAVEAVRAGAPAAPAAPAAEGSPDAAPAAAAPAEGAGAAPVDQPVELMVLSTDDGLHEGVVDALGSPDRVRRARTVAEAIELLAERPAGVLVTDAGIDEHAIEALIAELKAQVPELVTIVASERSDAHMMINLINHGQVFRFLIKPMSVGQCRIWLSSAASRHLELLQSPDVAARYRAAERDEGQKSLMGELASGVRGLKSRLGRWRARA
jgi:serine/threonine-protein kinase